MLLPDLKQLIKLKARIGANSFILEKTSNRTSGDYASLFHGLGVEFETVRPYVIGDDVRYIDWRVTARVGKPQIKTFRAESDRNVFVVVDANAYMRFGTRGTFKSIQAANAAAILCWKSAQQQDRVGGLVFGDIAGGMQYFAPSKTQSNILHLLKALCNPPMTNDQPLTLSTALNHLVHLVPPQSLIFILSDFSMEPIEKLEKSLLMLRKKSKVILLPVHDPADSDIPNIGSIVFTSGQHTETLDTSNTAARNAYRAAWDTYVAALTTISKKLKTRLLWLSTVKSGLLPIWKN